MQGIKGLINFTIKLFWVYSQQNTHSKKPKMTIEMPGEILALYITNRELISSLYKEHYLLLLTDVKMNLLHRK
jgi:hypothetical protein